MNTAKVFTTGRSQAVRLPKECRFDTDEVCIAKIDDMVILYPPKKGWALLARGIRGFTDDFMAAREQPDGAEERNEL
ncbi:MAG TPA: type II toxin-antitoxin system VapB family antitoxin [Phycisphaerae bacterium]|nr:type II toxin-antitoxin system VapB family antitoxin [Phycisphaerae bacterium]